MKTCLFLAQAFSCLAEFLDSAFNIVRPSHEVVFPEPHKRGYFGKVHTSVFHSYPIEHKNIRRTHSGSPFKWICLEFTGASLFAEIPTRLITSHRT
ncbi:hypothetical protein HanIR_Chr17g0849391 [Helianthus annuus]|nr:hypothetical protein HanIR_Chr17g0849391 [Helianthus annuus]